MTPPAAIQTLPSGRSLTVQVADGQEHLTVRSPDGAVEVQIVLTPAGAVVRLAAAKLEVAASDVAVKCDTFAVEATGGVKIDAGEFRVKTDQSIHLNGETVRLNCKNDPQPGRDAPPMRPLGLVTDAPGCRGGDPGEAHP
jgi:hypothetical protein